MAKKLKIPDDELKYIRWGSLLHDIGKMGVPDSIYKNEGGALIDKVGLSG